MKRQDEELWMKKLRESLKDYSEPPATTGWDRLAKEWSPVAEKRIRPFTWWAVAATILLAVSGISLFFLQSPTADELRHESTTTLTVAPDNDFILPDKLPESLIPEDKPSAMVKTEKTDYIAAVTGKVGEVPTGLEEPIVKVEDNTPDLSVKSGKTASTGDKQPAEQSATKTQDDRRIVRPSGKDKLHLPVTSGKERAKGNWSVAASFSNAAGTTISETQEYWMMADMVSPSPSQNSVANGMISINDKNNIVFDNGLPYLKLSASINEIKHKQPISFGISVRRNLTNGFSLESGVTYTLLASEGKSAVDGSKKIEQKLHYIGIPLRANWDFVRSRRFNVYLTAGGMIEKSVYGKIGTEKHTVKPLQFSLAGGLGGQLNISNRVGLYIEPGISYFFDDGSDVETIRKENPLNFNLQAGIRFTY